MLSIATQRDGAPVPVLRWSPTMHRKVEAARDAVFFSLGSSEPMIEETEAPLVATRQWRKPLSMIEVAQMADTQEVRARPGRA